MKILHICKKYPQALGGDAVVVSNLHQRQKAAGHHVTVVTSNCAEIMTAPHIYKLGLKDTPASLDVITFKRMLSLIALAFKMFVILARERPDVIHTHSVDMAFFASFAARLFGVPIVHTFHIVTFYDASQPAMRRKTELLLAKGARPHTITAPNKFDVKQLQNAGLTQTVLLPNGVDISFWQTATRGKGQEGFTFVAVGRLEQQKGYDTLIRAIALLDPTLHESFKLIIAGEGSQESALRALAQDMGVNHLVDFVGRKNQDHIRHLFATADAAVFPSLYETTPLTLLEAWAAGLPVVVTSVGILRDVPADFSAAYVVPPQDEQALMVAMNRCITDASSRLKVAANGYKEAQKYAWPNVAQTAEAIYRGTQ